MGERQPSIGVYRSGTQLESFMRMCGVSLTVAGSSRLPALIQAIIGVQERGEAGVLKTIIERAADPRDFIAAPEKLQQVLDYLNDVLVLDGLELRHVGKAVRLMQARTGAPVLSALATTLQTIDFDTVGRDLERALEGIGADPESAVTSACSVIESVCRSIIVELDPTAMPAKLDVQGLYKAVTKLLDLSAGREDLAPVIADDVRTILGGLNTVIQGIGALRTHAGDAHGRERRFRRIDARIARLAVHSASTVAQFLIETWQRKYPKRLLPAR
jgi:hypothetical protein